MLLGGLSMWHYFHKSIGSTRLGLDHRLFARRVGVCSCGAAVPRPDAARAYMERAAGSAGGMGGQRVCTQPGDSARICRKSGLYTLRISAVPPTRFNYGTMGDDVSSAVVSKCRRDWRCICGRRSAETCDTYPWCRPGSCCHCVVVRSGAADGLPQGKICCAWG